MKKVLSLISAGVTAGMLSASAMAAETWNMPTPYPDNNFHTVNIKQFADDVKAATGGALEIVVHGGGALIKHPEIKNAVRGGQVPIGETLLSRLSNENAVFGIDSVPFLAANYDDAKRLWAAARPQTEKLLDAQGLQVLFAVPWPPQGIYAKKELNSTDDLKGLKFRAYNAATERLAQLAGAAPTQIEAPDIAQAFATGRVDAMITSPSTGANSKAWDFVSYYYNTQAWLPKNIVLVNKEAFGKLAPEVQKAVMDAAAKAETRGWQASMAETEEKTQILKKNGIQVLEPSDKLAADMRKIGEQMTEEWAKDAGADGAAVLKAYK
jgi:TRAP-type C4-dicarboxylate transport system substrate-binding protein